jgi:2-dehydro-3-deoxy-D-arabinonate dehydratase
VWACGVTYLRSRDARMAESESAGGDVFYDLVYDAERPEIFFKATPHRVVGDGGAVRIRRDSTWDVPEPEFTLAVSPRGDIIGYTIGNDMSSRSIEGENPLYLPQAKLYDGCAALGPRLVIGDLPPRDTAIRLTIRRDGTDVFTGATALDQIKRRFDELVEHLFRDNSFPAGVFVMTGTGIVPGDDFSLAPGDEIAITIDPVGTLTNHVVRG